MSRARTGKVARIPAELRQKINEKLYEGSSGPQIIAWLDKAGQSITEQNLSEWRHGGYQDWLQSEEQMDTIRERAELALRMAQAAGGSLGSSIITRLASKIDENLSAISSENYEEIKPLLDSILMAEKLQLERRKADQKDSEIDITRQKFQRETVQLFLKWYKDQKALDIMDMPDVAADDKTNLLGQQMFGEDWK